MHSKTHGRASIIGSRRHTFKPSWFAYYKTWLFYVHLLPTIECHVTPFPPSCGFTVLFAVHRRYCSFLWKNPPSRAYEVRAKHWQCDPSEAVTFCWCEFCPNDWVKNSFCCDGTCYSGDGTCCGGGGACASGSYCCSDGGGRCEPFPQYKLKCSLVIQ